MSTLDSGWIFIAGVLLFVAWLGWTLLRSRRGKRDGDDAASVNAPQAAPPTDEPAVIERADPAPLAPALPSIVVPTAAPATAPVPAPALRQMEAIPPTRSRPPPPRIEHVLAVHPSRGVDDAGAGSIPLSPALAEALAALTASLPDSAEPSPGFAVHLPAKAALRIAQLDLAQLRSLAAEEAASAVKPLQWLDSTAAAELAAMVLAAEAAERLRAVADEMNELKAALASLPPKAAGADDARLRSLVQEGGRYARDARDNYAGLIGRTSFRERVDEAAARALTLWREHIELDGRRRSQLEALVATPRFGEVQVERARSLLQEHRNGERVLALVGRSASALGTLRLLLGQPHADPGDALQAVDHALHQALEHDALLRARLQAAEAGARGDPYVGRGEFEANRAALRKLLDGLGSDLLAARERVALAGAALTAGFPAAAGDGWRCELRAGDGSAGELRVRPLPPADAPTAR